MSVTYDQIEPEVSKSFKNIKKMQGKNIRRSSENSLTLNTHSSGKVLIIKDLDARVYDFYNFEENNKVTEDKKFFSMNLSDDPSVEFTVSKNVKTAIFESMDVLRKYNKKKLVSGQTM